ncbi:MAG: alpha/beta fold hydrolase, partial [Oscillospiraceae bacterium]|nr:alpha/beta fold hydrolase [Oscillospiraceae bacterium]
MEKKTVLIVHGWMHSGKRYEKLKEDLEKGGEVKVALHEFPGFGESRPTAYFRVLRRYERDMGKLLREREYDFVIGHSMGGNILLRALSDMECRPRLILLSPAYGGMNMLKPMVILYPFIYVGLFLTQKIECRLTDFLIKCAALLTINDRKKIDGQTIADVRRASALAALNTMMELAWDGWRVEPKKWTGRKVELILGENDRIITKRKMEKLAQALGDVNVHTIGGIGHTAVLENYDVLLEMLRGMVAGKGAG